MTRRIGRGRYIAERLHKLITLVPTGFLWISVVLWMLPTVGLFLNSLRPPADQRTTGWWEILTHPGVTLAAYERALGSGNPGTLSIAEAFVNSLAIAVPATVIPLGIAAASAYAFAWMSFPGRHALFLIVVGLLVVPVQATLVPLLQLMNALGLRGSLPSLWLIHTAFTLPFGVLLLHNAIAQVPKEVIESARIDGAGHVTLFTGFVLPLAFPALAAFATLQFLGVWNDYLVALIFIQSSAPANAPMTILLVNLVTEHGQGLELLPAAAFISMVVPMVVFFALQRYFVKGLIAGAVKG